MASLTDFSQYANSPGQRAHCYAELLLWMKPLLVLVAPTHRGMARLSCLENTGW